MIRERRHIIVLVFGDWIWAILRLRLWFLESEFTGVGGSIVATLLHWRTHADEARRLLHCRLKP